MPLFHVYPEPLGLSVAPLRIVGSSTNELSKDNAELRAAIIELQGLQPGQNVFWAELQGAMTSNDLRQTGPLYQVTLLEGSNELSVVLLNV